MADNTIELTIVTPERSVVHESVDELMIPGRDGYFGVLPGHAPLFSELKIGEISCYCLAAQSACVVCSG